MRIVAMFTLLLFLVGCVQGDFVQAGGTYDTRCSASMQAKGEEYFARCTPAACEDGYVAGPVNHVVVAIDPGSKVLGYAERICLADPTQTLRGSENEVVDEAEPEGEEL